MRPAINDEFTVVHVFKDISNLIWPVIGGDLFGRFYYQGKKLAIIVW
jgi:hypothetical protein